MVGCCRKLYCRGALKSYSCCRYEHVDSTFLKIIDGQVFLIHSFLSFLVLQIIDFPLFQHGNMVHSHHLANINFFLNSSTYPWLSSLFPQFSIELMIDSFLNVLNFCLKKITLIYYSYLVFSYKLASHHIFLVFHYIPKILYYYFHFLCFSDLYSLIRPYQQNLLSALEFEVQLDFI